MIQDTVMTRRTIITTAGQGVETPGVAPESAPRTAPFGGRRCTHEPPVSPAQPQPQPVNTVGALEKVTALVERMVGEFNKVMEKAFSAIEKLTEKVSELLSAKTLANTEASSPAEKSPGSSKTEGKSQNLGKTGEFLWKPASDKDGKLAILLPSRMTGKVKSVKVLDAKGEKTLATGKYSGVGNGDREHFRFTKSGSQFPKGAMVEITLSSGEKRRVTIENTAQRTTR